MEKIKKFIDNFGIVFSGFFMFFLSILFMVLFFTVGIDIIYKVDPFFVKSTILLAHFVIFILLPLSFFKKIRSFSIVSLYVLSFWFGITLWIHSAVTVHYLWGTVALFIGLFLMGVGVLPVAIIAAIFFAEWMILLDLILLIIATFGSRILGVYMAHREDRKSQIYNNEIIE